MSITNLDSNILTAGNNIAIDTKHVSRDIVYNYYLASQPTSGFHHSQVATPDDPSKLLFMAGKDILLKAAKESNIGIVKGILDYVLDINCSDDDKRSALHSAAACGCIDIATLMLSRPGINVNARDKNGQTPLLLASMGGYVELVKLLLSHPGIDLNAQDGCGGTALIHASDKGHTVILRLLLDHPGISVNIKTNIGNTALMSSTYWGQVDSVRVLLTHPCIELNFRNTYGITALEMALLHHYTDIASMLRDKGAAAASPATVVTNYFTNWFSLSK